MKKSKPVYSFNIPIKNPAFTTEYKRRLQDLITKYHNEIKDIVDKNYYSDQSELDFVSLFQEMIKRNTKFRADLNKLPGDFFNKKLKFVNNSMEKSFKKATVQLAQSNKVYIGKDGKPAKVMIPAITFTATREERAFLKSSAIENSQLIRSIGEEHIRRASSAISNAMQTGSSREELFEELSHGYGITKRRAAIIAIDQSSKITEQLSTFKMKNCGIKEGIWIHSHGDKKPRQTHLKMDGKKYNLDKGLYDSQVGKYVIPGELPGCTCTKSPVIPDEWMETK